MVFPLFLIHVDQLYCTGQNIRINVKVMYAIIEQKDLH